MTCRDYITNSSGVSNRLRPGRTVGNQEPISADECVAKDSRYSGLNRCAGSEMTVQHSFGIRTYRIRAILALTVILCLFQVGGRAQTPPSGGFVRGEVVVELRPGVSIGAVNGRYGTTTLRRLFGTNIYRLALPAGQDEAAAVTRLSADPDIISAGLNPLVSSPFTAFARSIMAFPDSHPTPGQGRNTFLAQTLVEDLTAVNLRSTGNNILVAIIDTGVDRTHPDLQSRLWTNPLDPAGNGVDDDNNGLEDDFRGWDFFDNDNDPTETLVAQPNSISGHGTFIAGLISLLAPGARIMPLRAFGSDGTGDAFSVASAIKYAADHHAQVINLSFGSPSDSSVLRDAIEYARQRGSVLIAAVGNENSDTDVRPQFPASYKLSVMGVAATDLTGVRASFSNFGGAASVDAPGLRVTSTFPGGTAGDYATWSGTSFAAPLATAEAALILEAYPKDANVRAVIEQTAVSIDGANPQFAGKLGKGAISPLKALQSLNPGSDINASIALIPTGIEQPAGGTSEVTILGTQQEFTVEARGLTARSSYKIVVDANVFTDSRFQATNFGELKVEFATTPDAQHLALPPALAPVNKIKHVEVRDMTDRIILQADFGSVGGTVPPPGQSFEKEASLLATASLPQASGSARVEVEATGEELRVEGQGLVSGVVYQIVVDTLPIGSAVAQSGYFKVKFTSDGSSGLLLPAALRPANNINLVQVRNPAGQIVLQGVFRTSGDDVGGGDAGGLEFRGRIEALPSVGFTGNWRVSGRVIHVTSTTILNQVGADIALGVLVEVEGTQRADSSMDARKIEVKTADGLDVRKDFLRTGIDSDAGGEVRIKISGGREELKVEAEKLSSHSTYSIFINGASAGNVSTDGGGGFEKRWRTNSDDPPPPVRPVTKVRLVEIRDSRGRVVLTVSMT